MQDGHASDLRSMDVRAVRDDRAAAIAVPPEVWSLFCLIYIYIYI